MWGDIVYAGSSAGQVRQAVFLEWVAESHQRDGHLSAETRGGGGMHSGITRLLTTLDLAVGRLGWGSTRPAGTMTLVPTVVNDIFLCLNDWMTD